MVNWPTFEWIFKQAVIFSLKLCYGRNPNNSRSERFSFELLTVVNLSTKNRQNSKYFLLRWIILLQFLVCFCWINFFRIPENIPAIDMTTDYRDNRYGKITCGHRENLIKGLDRLGHGTGIHLMFATQTRNEGRASSRSKETSGWNSRSHYRSLGAQVSLTETRL